MGFENIGEPKTCEQIIKDNLKEFKPLANIPGFGSPNIKFKKLIGQGNKVRDPYDIMAPVAVLSQSH